MFGQTFSMARQHPPREGLTISTPVRPAAEETSVVCFSLGAGTDITPETYASPVLYLGCAGSGVFHVGAEGPDVLSGRESCSRSVPAPCAASRLGTDSSSRKSCLRRIFS